jgi:hypothetical protein
MQNIKHKHVSEIKKAQKILRKEAEKNIHTKVKKWKSFWVLSCLKKQFKCSSKFVSAKCVFNTLENKILFPIKILMF